MSTAPEGATAPARFAPLAWLAGGREGLDRTLFLASAGMVPLAISNPAWQSLHAVAWLLLAGAMLRERRWLVAGPRRWAAPWLVFLGWNVLSAALAPEAGAALVDTKKLLNVLALFLFGTVLRRADDARRVLLVAGAVLSLEAILALVQYVQARDPLDQRIHGTLSHHMTFTGLLLLGSLLCLPLLRVRPRHAPGWAFMATAAAALLASLTRSAWLALGPALALIVFFRRRRWLWALPLALVLALVLVPQVRDRALSMFDTRTDHSNVHRLNMYPTGLRMIAEHPVLGLGGRRQVRLRYTEFEVSPKPPPAPEPGGSYPEPYEPPLHLHNTPLQLAAESGIPALLAWLAALAVYFREAFRGLARARDPLGRDLLLGSLAAVAAFLTMGMLEYNLGDSEVSVLFFFALSIPFGAARPAGAAGDGPEDAV